MSWADWNRKHECWQDATWAERQLRDMLRCIAAQNEVILAKIEKREPKLSPQDQADLNTMFEVAKATGEQLDEAQKP